MPEARTRTPERRRAQAVEIVAPSTVPVKIVDVETAKPGPDGSLPATTTAQEDVVYHGQQRVNLIWEYTQATIAIMVIVVNLATAAYLAIDNRSKDHPEILSWTLALVIGFYFSRTNHTAVGGISPKPRENYQGR